MGDRLTLETADERDVWLDEFAAKTGENWQPGPSSYAAWDAVRAYRERLPTSDGGVCFCGYEDCDGDVWVTQGQDGWCVEHAADAALCMLDPERRAAVLSLHEWGPTEGASDAAVRQIVREMQVWADGLSEREPNIAGHLLHHARRIMSALCERPPTGGASPEAVEDIGRPLAGLGFEMTARMSKAMHASPEPSVPDAPGWWWLGKGERRRVVEVFVPADAPPDILLVTDTRGTYLNCPVHHIDEPWGGRCLRGSPASDADDKPGWTEAENRAHREALKGISEARAKLTALIGAVEDALDIEHETPVMTIRAALDAAKGDTQDV